MGQSAVCLVEVSAGICGQSAREANHFGCFQATPKGTGANVGLAT